MSDRRPFVSMVMIARDEADNVEACFDSFWPHADQVVLVDTGSTDSTVETAKLYAEKHGEQWIEVHHKDDGTPAFKDVPKLIIGHFDWCDDFAAARNYADSLATGEWLSWIDLDDSAIGLDKLRELATGADPIVSAFFTSYDYGVTETGVVICELERERLVRTGTTEWVGRVHEYQHIRHGGIVHVAPEIAKWVHRKPPSEATNERNLRLLQSWLQDDPTNPRVLAYIGLELAGNQRLEEALPYFERYAECAGPSEPPDARAQIARYRSSALLVLGRREEAKRVTTAAMVENPSWPDSYLTLAEIAHDEQNWARTIEFATEVVRRGKPDTPLIVNPLDYTARPRVLIASSLGQLGQLPEAIQTCEQVQEIAPNFMGIDATLAQLRATKQREETAATWQNAIQLLIGLDEIEKAVVLLATVPFFIADHPQIIATRVLVEQRLAEPYKVRTIADDDRGRFLVRELTAQRDALADDAGPLCVLDLGSAATDWLRTQLDGLEFIDAADAANGTVVPDAIIASAEMDNQYDPVERITHLTTAVHPEGRLYVISPEGIIDGKRTPGRRRSLRGIDVVSMLRRRGKLTSIAKAEGHIMVGVQPCHKREEVAIWTGRAIGPWHPLDIETKGLGGSETAAWRIAEELAQLGYVVTLYGQFTEEGCVRDVVLRDWRNFDPLDKRLAVIAFRNAEMFEMPNINAKKRILWLEDVAGAEGLTPERATNLDIIATVSEWHRHNVISTFPWLDARKVHAHRNGITLSYFEDGEQPPEREKRVLYTSSPDRGLDIVLELWPEIVKRVPDATLAHCYGPWYDLCAKFSPAIAEHRKDFMDRADMSSIESVGNLGQRQLALLMRSSLVWVAPSYFSIGGEKFTETSCISAMEAQAAGLRIVASRWGALQETVQTGVLLDGDPTGKESPEWRERFVEEVVRALTDPNVQALAQTEGPEKVKDLGWRGVAEGLMREWGHHPQEQPLLIGAEA